MLNQKIIEIHERAVRRGRQYLKTEAEIIESLQELDRERVYLNYTCKSLHAYVVRFMGLTDSVASSFVTVARKAKEVPALKEAIDSGRLQVQKARKITPVLSQDNQKFWLDLATQASQRVIEKEVARVRPELEKPERARYIREDRVNVNLNMSEDVFELFKRAQDLESQKLRRAAKLEDTLEAALRVYVEKQDPFEKAKRAEERRMKAQERGIKQDKRGDESENENKKESENENKNEKETENKKEKDMDKGKDNDHENEQYKSRELKEQRSNDTSASVSRHVADLLSKARRAAIPAHVEHQVNLRDQNRCTYTNEDGERCEQRRWIEIHHITPLSLGGQNGLENLITLCSGHHKVIHCHKTKLSS